MRQLDCCPSCASGGIRNIKEYVFLNRFDDYASCKTYLERRLFILDRVLNLNKTPFKNALCYCANCDLLFANPRFDNDEIAKKYQMLNDLNSTEMEYRKTPMRNVDKRAKRIFDLLKDNSTIRSGKILDIGGQFGYNLKYFDGFERNIVDYEEHDYQTPIAYLGSSLGDINAKFDFIISNHTVEHLPYFEDFFQNMERLLSGDGIVYIEVPCGALREAYAIVEPMTHFNFFSELSLSNLLIRYGLYPFYVKTKYQEITSGSGYCINILASKKKVDKLALMSSKQQKYNIFYLMDAVFNKIVERLRIY
jgi:SAM-dependent methyltransferase